MAKEIKLPQLGQTMEEGTIVSAEVKEGDFVNKGDVLFNVETDKATLEMESPAEGYVKKILVEAGETIPVNELVMILGDKDEEVVVPAKTEEPAAAPAPTGEIDAGDFNVINLPQLGQTMEEGTILSAEVTEGVKVAKGDVLFSVETDKATLEMESPAEGFVKKVLVEVGETIPVNSPVIILGDEASEVPQALVDSLKAADAAPAAVEEPAPAPAPAPVVEAPAPKPAPVPVTQAPAGGRIFASPRAKMKAKELGVDLSTVQYSGVRIVEADVIKASQSQPAVFGGAPAKTLPVMPAPAYNLGDKVKVSRMQKVVSDKMVQSKRDIPCFYLNTSVDATDLFKFRSQLNKTSPVKISFNDFIIKALAVAIKQFPIMAGQIDGADIKIADSIDIGLAIAVEGGLVAPMTKGVNDMTLAQVAAYNQDMIAKAKSNKLSPADLSGGCCTVSNLGGFGIESFIPIVVPSQTSILGVGKIADACVPSDGNILVRKIMKLTLSVDHKVVNGAEAAQFLDYLKKLLEAPQELT